MGRMRSLGVTVGLAILAGSLVSCRPGTVDLRFRPAVATATSYTTTVSVTSVSRLGDRPPERQVDRVELEVRHTVLATDTDPAGDGTLVAVDVTDDSGARRRYQVRFDRGAQLRQIEQVDGRPAPPVGALGLAELFPAAGTVPDRRLKPGERFPVDELVRLPGLDRPAALRGEGRVVALGVQDGDDRATITSNSRLELPTVLLADDSTDLAGDQRTESTVVYDVSDGTVARADAVTVQDFEVTVRPPPGVEGEPVRGTLDITIHSRTRRI
ncbi:hypothetical protein BH20ACT2_BH20ACT2_19610 [soil metagenome]